MLTALCGGLSAQSTGQTKIAKEERIRYVEDSLLAARLGIGIETIERLRDSVRLMASKTYVIENFVSNTDSRLSDSRTPKGSAGGDLTGTYPNPTIKSSVALTGSPTAPTPATTTNNTQIATTAYVKSNLGNYVTTSDSRLTNSRTPTGTAGGDLTGTYPNPTIKSSVALTGSPTAPTPATTTNNTQIATTAYVKSNLGNYVTTSDSRLTNSRTPTGTAGGDLTGTYPNPTIKSSVTLNGNPTVTGNLRLKGSGNYGNKLNFGDGEYVYLYEETDDNLTIKASTLNLSATTVTAPTPTTSDNSTKVATTAYVKSLLPNRSHTNLTTVQTINLLPGASYTHNISGTLTVKFEILTQDQFNACNTAYIVKNNTYYINFNKTSSTLGTILFLDPTGTITGHSDNQDFSTRERGIYKFSWISRYTVLIEFFPLTTIIKG